MSSRKEARRTTLTLLYQWDLTRQPLASLYEGEIDPFASTLAGKVIEQADALDERITDASNEWPADRLGIVERAALRMAIVELDEQDVPQEVVINEAVALTKRFASQEAASLVNGILGCITRSLPDTR